MKIAVCIKQVPNTEARLRVSRDEDGGDGDEGAGRTVVELAGLDRSSGGDLAAEVDELQRLVQHTGPSGRDSS